MGILSTNHKIISIGHEYSAGENIGISDDYVISSKDWSEEIAQATSSVSGDISALSAAIDYVSANAGDQEVDSLVHTNSGYWNDVSSKLDTTAFSTVSGTFLTAHQDLSDYATTAQVDSTSSFLSGAIDYVSANAGHEYTGISPIGVDNSTYTISAYTWVFSAGSGISLVDDNANKVTTIEVTAHGGDVEVENLVKTNSGSWNDVSSKLDTTSFSNVSGNFLTAIPSEYVTDTELETVSGNITALIPSTAGLATETLVQNTSASITSLIPTNYYPDTNPSGFITGVDLSDYQTTAGMTAYQEAGNYYSASNPSGFITGVDLTPYATTAEVDTLSSFLSGAIDYVSANAGGVISSYTTSWSDNVPPYGNNVINSLNGLYISSFVSNSAGTANNATNANSALSAGYAQTVNVNYVENEGFVRNLSSEYGTISVIHNNLVDSTNSAISRTGYEGFVSSYEAKSIGPQATAHYSWNESLPNNMFDIGLAWVNNNSTLFYSADTNLTGQIQLPQGGGQTYSFNIPNATALDIWCTNWISVDNAVASAADTFETVVGELAWASALPSYEYNSTNKISAINGSAIAAGDEFPASANEAITAYQTNSGTYLTAISIPDSATWNDVSTTVQTNSASWNNVSSKLDTTAFSDVSGTFLTAVDLTPYQPTSGMTAYQVAGDYYSASNPSGFITGVPNEFSAQKITLRTDPYGIAWMELSENDGITFKEFGEDQTVNFHTVEQWNTTKNTVDEYGTEWSMATTEVQTNSASWNSVSSKQDTLTFDYDVQNKISAINNSAIAGGDVPEDVMVETNLEYNSQGFINGYNGSAVATIDQERQLFAHDDTLVHLSNSSQYALGVNLSGISADLARLMGVDETVLWSGSANSGTLNLSEPLTSFNEFKFYVYVPERGTNQVLTYYDAVNPVNPGYLQLTINTMTTGSVVSAWWQGIYNINGTVDTATYKTFSIYANGQYYKQCSTTACGTNNSKMVIKKVIGIGRKN